MSTGHITYDPRLTSHVEVIHSSTTLLQLDIPLQLLPLRIIFVILLLLFRCLGNKWCSNNVVSGLWLSNMYPVDDGVDLAPFELVLHSCSEQSITGCILQIHHPFFGIARDLNRLDALRIDDLLYEGTGFGMKIFETSDIDFVHNEESGLAVE